MGRTFGPYPARCVSIHDGDTIRFDLDLGFGIHALEFNCRVWGINAPELKTQAGKDALAYLKTLLAPGDACQVTSHGWDKYGGRYDGTVTLPGGNDLAAEMLAAGHAVVMKE